jgi:hypothetical protein
MAVTINQTPQAFTPSDNDLMYVFTSNQTGQANFSFEVDLVVDGVVETTDQVFPRIGGTTNYNVKELVAPLFDDPNINTDISATADLMQSMDVFKEINIVVRELYGSPPTVQDTATSSVSAVWKAALSDLQFIDYDSTIYTPPGDDKLFLTNFPREHKYWVDIEKSNYISFYLPVDEPVQLGVQTFDQSGASISQFAYNLSDRTKDVYILNVSPKELTAVNFSNAAYYEIQVRYGTLPSVVVALETFKFYINRPCVKDRTVYFINKLGGVDSWIFNKRKTSNRTFDRAVLERQFGRLVGTSYEYDKFYSRELNYSNNSENTITLDTDWTNQDILTWLVKELLESPLVWMEDENDNKIAFHITNASESEPQERYEELSQLSITLASGFKSRSIWR